MEKRAIIVSTVIICGFFAVMFRLADIMLLNHDSFSVKAKQQQIKEKDISATRGIIFDRKGRKLAINLDTKSLFVDPSRISSPDKVAFALSEIINQKPDRILTRLNRKGRFSWIERKLSLQYAQKIKDLSIEGIGFLPETKRFYPKRSLASHIIGFVNIDNKGLEGIENKYDRYLTAEGKNIYVARDAKGNVLSDSFNKEIMGNSLILTIDEGLQYIVEKNLDAAILQWDAAAATVIMMNPHTGEILAMANRPTFDPNNPSKARASQRRNRAITDLFEPGSTFKIVIGVAALEEGIVTPDTLFDCSDGYIMVGGRRIRDISKNDILTFAEVIQKSSNVGTIKVGLDLGKEKIYEYIKKFGFGERTGIDLIGEVSGFVRPPKRWSGVSVGSISIGYEISVTPLQILRAYSAIANGGFLVTPYVVSGIISPASFETKGRIVYKAVPEIRRIISEESANTFKEILAAATEEGSTGTNAAISGNRVAGKTGTALQIDPETGRYCREKAVSSFVGFAPANNPKIATIVVIHEPKGSILGGVVAAPVFRKITDESLSYLGVPKDDSLEKELLLVSIR